MPFTPVSGGRYDPVADFGPESNHPLPEGWSWYTLPHYYGRGDCDPGVLQMSSNSRTTYEVAITRLKALRDWAIEHDLYVEFSGGRRAPEGMNYRTSCHINPQSEFAAASNDSLLAVTNPFNPDERVDPFIEELDGLRMACAGCGSALHYDTGLREGTSAGFTPDGVEEGGRWLGCRNCFGACSYRPEQDETPEQAEAQARLLGRPQRATRPRRVRGPYCGAICPRGQGICAEHADPFTCPDCSGTFDRNLNYHLDNPDTGESYCEVCASRRCNRCMEPRGTSRRVLDDGYVCQPCWELANVVRIERRDEVRMTADELLIPALPDRPTRLVSIEQEFEGASGREGHGVAMALFNAGLTCYAERMRYHSGDHSFPAHVEADRSVENGGELIYNRLDLADPMDAQHMASICDIVTSEVAANRISFTAKCGTHTHIDLHGYSIADARNYVTIYSYLEDVIFRLGSAGYGDHRSVVSKSSYALPLRKDKWGNLVEFGVEFLRNADHTDSLNMQHFYNSLKSCTCGAIEFGNIDDCKCIRTKCTAEWRVFNGTGNPRKLHAWVAFVQAVTSWCQDRDLDLDLYEPLSFEQTIDFTKDLGDAHRNLIEAWKPRLMWIWATLPLTDSEKASIMYCIENSPLKHVGPEFLAELAQVERVVDEDRVLTLGVIASRFGEGESNAPAEARELDPSLLDEEPPYDDDEEPYDPDF